ncbi:STAS domain-containing protein [Ramlibacter lithotrophicus]|nr:STAS domain-containing protein [Ramlibacter lithotrophicus]
MNADRATAMDDAPARISLAGSMTIYEAPAQKAQLLAALAGAAALDLDLAQVDEADTAGLQLLLLLRREGARAGKPVRVLGLGPALLDVLDRYGLGTAFADPSPRRADGAAGGQP